MLKIDKAIPPPVRDGRGKSKGYTTIIEALEPGDSVAIPSSYGSVYRLALRVRRKHGRDFQIAREPESDAHRIWRVA
jgi:cystathionine beta-lyase/cystathionine gamma-synthase